MSNGFCILLGDKSTFLNCVTEVYEVIRGTGNSILLRSQIWHKQKVTLFCFVFKHQELSYYFFLWLALLLE